MAAVVIDVFVVDKRFWFLLNGIVSQMHEEIVKVGFWRALILSRCKPSQTLLVDKDTQWVYTEDKHVDS